MRALIYIHAKKENKTNPPPPATKIRKKQKKKERNNREANKQTKSPLCSGLMRSKTSCFLKILMLCRGFNSHDWVPLV